jgi:hypothetical protein
MGCENGWVVRERRDDEFGFKGKEGMIDWFWGEKGDDGLALGVE